MNRSVQEYFDHEVRSYLDAYRAEPSTARGEIFHERRRLALAFLREPLGRVLDVGAGPAVFADALLRRGGECWMVDASLNMVQAGREQLDGDPDAHRAHHAVADVERLPFGDGAFDTVLCIGVLQYVQAPEQALHELARVTRRGGRMIVSFPNAASPLNRLHRAAIALARGGRAALRWVGCDGAVSPSRLTYRSDIPNELLAVREVVGLSSRLGLRVEGSTCHSAHFPFAVPGCSPALRTWDRAANGALRAGWFRSWGREAIVCFSRNA
jgi:ubiquinone/menaquinone biosynthesis C-methylase UbiE